MSVIVCRVAAALGSCHFPALPPPSPASSSVPFPSPSIRSSGPVWNHGFLMSCLHLPQTVPLVRMFVRLTNLVFFFSFLFAFSSLSRFLLHRHRVTPLLRYHPRFTISRHQPQSFHQHPLSLTACCLAPWTSAKSQHSFHRRHLHPTSSPSPLTILIIHLLASARLGLLSIQNSVDHSRTSFHCSIATIACR